MCPTCVLNFWSLNYIRMHEIASKNQRSGLIIVRIDTGHRIAWWINFWSLINAKDLQFLVGFNINHRIGWWVYFGSLDGTQKIRSILFLLSIMNIDHRITHKIAWSCQITQLMWATTAWYDKIYFGPFDPLCQSILAIRSCINQSPIMSHVMDCETNSVD